MKFILIGFFLRLLVAIWNGFFGPSFGAEGDAIVFHEIATEVASQGVFDTKFNIGWIYAYFLGIIYFELQKYKQSKFHYENSLKLSPNSKEIFAFM